MTEHQNVISSLRRQVMIIEAGDAACGSPSNVKFMRDAFEHLERYRGITPEQVAGLRMAVDAAIDLGGLTL